MPYKRRAPVKRRTYKKRPAPKSFTSYAISALKGYALKKLKSKLGINTELKYLDFAEAAGTATTTTMSTTAQIVNPIPQGDTTNSRQGNSLRLTSCNSTFTFRAAALSTSSSRVRLVLMYQPRMQTAGAIFVASDIFTDTTANIETPYSMNTNGFNILYDKTFEIAANGQTGSTKEINFHYKPLNHHIEFTDADTTGVATNLLQGYLRWFVCTDAGSNVPTYSSYTRIKWVDN